MNSGIIMAILFAATLAGGAQGVQATPPPDPWEMIGADSLHDYCHPGDLMLRERSDAGENPGQQMGPSHDKYFSGGPPGLPPSARRFTGEAGRPPVMMPHENNASCLMKVLDLNDAQKKQIAVIILEEREKVLPVLKKRAEVREKINQAERAATFDEKSVRTLSGNLAQLEADMMVSRVKTRSRVSAVLTPAQRELVKKLENVMARDPSRQAMHE